MYTREQLKFAVKVAVDLEREACAVAVESIPIQRRLTNTETFHACLDTIERAVDAIRARGTQPKEEGEA